jgi:hypothetical protein
MCSTSYSSCFSFMLAMLPLLCCSGCKSDNTQSSYSAKDVVRVSMTYPGWGLMDANVPRITVKVDGSGKATCSRQDPSGAPWTGQQAASDSAIPDLLSLPGLVGDLAVPCPVVVKDAGPYVSTHFANDADDMDHARLVSGSCSTPNLESLVQALERIGDSCIATANVHVDVLDGGSPAEVRSDVAQVDSRADDAPVH